MGYITCNAKKNRPRVNVAVCAKCRQKKGCPDYGNYIQFPLFPGLFQTTIMTPDDMRRMSKLKKIRSEPPEILDKPLQLALDLQSSEAPLDVEV